MDTRRRSLPTASPSPAAWSSRTVLGVGRPPNPPVGARSPPDVAPGPDSRPAHTACCHPRCVMAGWLWYPDFEGGAQGTERPLNQDGGPGRWTGCAADGVRGRTAQTLYSELGAEDCGVSEAKGSAGRYPKMPRGEA
ncbi:hypothetical protein MJT46_009023 [Ovis ammon polii x Ovis aries]|nr:hypothetical protein MJT46_009023 [Ovis ammon polii x Ovis aries]